MKLRSGKIIKQPLPKVLEEKLNEDLSDFKALLANNEELAKELIKIIAIAHNIDSRHEIMELIEETFKGINIKNSKFELLETCGSLLTLIVGSNDIYANENIFPLYHDTLQQTMFENFDIDSSLLGNIEI